MRPLSVLLTNSALGQRGGSETYLRDVAVALLRRGHRPVAFSLALGGTADDLRRATIPVIDDIGRMTTAPDVIHGHHHLETLIAALAFPATPIVNFCHGWLPWEELPLRHPSVRKYVAVDEVCVDRLLREEGIPPAQVEQLLNFVDLERFPPRDALPARPRRALILSNAATRDGYAAAIARACEGAGVELEIAGASAGNATATPLDLLRRADVVFAKARTALEAMAVGCAVVLADRVGAGPLVTPANFDRLRARNFGVRELQRAHDAAWYASQLAGYSADDAAFVSRRVRAEADLEPSVDRLLAIYGEAIAAPPGIGQPSAAAAAHLSRIAGPMKRAMDLTHEVAVRETELATARTGLEDLAAVRGRVAVLERERESLALEFARAEELVRERSSEAAGAVRALEDLRGANARVEAELRAANARVEAELRAVRALPALRLRNAVVGLPLVGPAMQRLARALARRAPSS